MSFLFRPLRSIQKFKLFQVEPTLRCNLNCAMCPWTSIRVSTSDMAWDTFLSIARSFAHTEEVDLTGGGEPLLHPRLGDMVSLAKEHGCHVGFSTNATLLTPEISSDLMKRGLDWIAYSVDGATSRTYEEIRRGASFENVIFHVHEMEEIRRKLKPPRPLTMLFYVMMRANVHELPLMVDLCVDLGIDKLVVKNLDVILSMEHDAQRIFQWESRNIDPFHQEIVKESINKARQHGLFIRVYDLFPKELTICEQDPLHTAFFNWEGYVSPCITLAYGRARVFQGTWHRALTLRFGNCNETPFEEIWESQAYREFRQLFQQRKKGSFHHFIQSIVGDISGKDNDVPSMSRVPEGCRICHYLYAV